MSYRLMMRIAGVGSLLAAVASPAWADVIQLSSGRSLDGVVVEDTTARVRVQVTWQGYISLHPEEVAAIARSEPAQRAQLLEQWRREFDAAKEHAQAREAFEASQRAQGLVQHRGVWISQDELAAIREEHARIAREREDVAERQRREAEARRLTERVAALEEERLRLQHMLAYRWALFTQPAVIIRRAQPCEPPAQRAKTAH